MSSKSKWSTSVQGWELLLAQLTEAQKIRKSKNTLIFMVKNKTRNSVFIEIVDSESV